MSSASAKDDETKKPEEGKEEGTKEEEGEKKEEVSAPPVPPLEAAARRLERLLDTESFIAVASYTNPAKVMRRWLGTSSGASGKATLSDIKLAAETLLNPESVCQTGRSLILEYAAQHIDDAMDTTATPPSEPKYLSKTTEREFETWLLSLVIRLLWKSSEHQKAFDLSQATIQILMKHIGSATAKITTKSSLHLVSLFPLLARVYRYRSLVAEHLVPTQPQIAVQLRSDMVQAHGMACLRRDVDTQATLLNLMLHDLLNASQVEQAQKLLTNSTFPDAASNNQLCRFLYHSGRIQALRLEYTSAFSNLSQSIRKAPSNTGLGFRIAAQRLLVVVQLLMGEIPDRHVFFQKGMKTELLPYMAITQAVRRGDLSVFTQAVSEHAARLKQDGTYTLISRLAHQVVKAGLRKLHVSYSRISLQDVADRLGLPSATSAEFVVAKAVRDGVLDATIQHKEGYVQSHDLVDVYATKEPSEAFHRRIAYCLTTHNDAVRGMRYPPDAYKKQLEASRNRGGKRGGKGGEEEKTDEEKVKDFEDEMEDEY